MADIAEWLVGLGLRKYAAIFAAHEIDLEFVRLLTEDDVRELGLPIGPRRKLLHAVAALMPGTLALPRERAHRDTARNGDICAMCYR